MKDLRRLRKGISFKRSSDASPPLQGRKGGRVRRERAEVRQIDKELRDWAYR